MNIGGRAVPVSQTAPGQSTGPFQTPQTTIQLVVDPRLGLIATLPSQQAIGMCLFLSSSNLQHLPCFVFMSLELLLSLCQSHLAVNPVIQAGPVTSTAVSSIFFIKKKI